MTDQRYSLSNTEVIIPKSPVGIVGVGSYLPPKVVTNDDFTNLELSDQEADFINTKSGMKERRLAVGETYTDMAVKAAKNALKSAKISPEEIDLVVVTHITRDIQRLSPPNSTYIQTAIGAKNATSINVDMGCSGWIYALVTGASFIISGFYKRVIVVSGESLLPHTESDIMKAMLMGDGAGAFILEETAINSGMLGYHLMSWEFEDIASEVKVMEAKAGPDDDEPELKPFFCIAPNSFERDLPYVKNLLPFSVLRVLEKLKIGVDKVDHFIFAQKFDWLNREWAKAIGIDYSKVRETLDRTACVETSSIPIIAQDAFSKKCLQKGDLVMFADLGANWSVGAALFRWCI